VIDTSANKIDNSAANPFEYWQTFTEYWQYAGWSKKVSHYEQSSLNNRIKNHQGGNISHLFWVWTEHRNVRSLYYIFYVWPNFWRHQLLCWKLRHG